MIVLRAHPVRVEPKSVAPSAPVFKPVEHIQRRVAARYRIEPHLMRSADRHRDLAWPRQRAMWLAKTLLDKPLTDIGRLFGDRDHSTVFHAIKAVDKRMAKDPLERAEMKQLLASLEHLRRHG